MNNEIPFSHRKELHSFKEINTMKNLQIRNIKIVQDKYTKLKIFSVYSIAEDGSALFVGVRSVPAFIPDNKLMKYI